MLVAIGGGAVPRSVASNIVVVLWAGDVERNVVSRRSPLSLVRVVVVLWCVDDLVHKVAYW